VGRLLQVLRVLTSLAMSIKYSFHDGRIKQLALIKSPQESYGPTRCGQNHHRNL
jgi:hypothetical protein